MSNYGQKRARNTTSEEDVGMKTTISSCQIFRAGFKDFYSDFIVREIPLDSEDKPLELTSLDPPEDSHQGIVPTAPIINSETEKNVVSVFSPLIGEDQATHLASIVMGSNEISHEDCKLEIEKITDRETRVKVHQAVKDILSCAGFISVTENGVLIIKKGTKEECRDQRRRTRSKNPDNYLRFVLYKENIDGSSALRFIARTLCISSRRLEVAGTKDKRALTVQMVSCKGLEAKNVARVNKLNPGGNGVVKVGNFYYTNKGLRLGDLKGNHFTIVLRIVDEETARQFVDGSYPVHEIETQLRERGFVNYFGVQRFGTTSIPTSSVGEMLLKGDIEGAILFILKSKGEICPEMDKTIELYLKSQEPGSDYRECISNALSVCPHFCYMERDILMHLQKNPHDYQGAMMSIPRISAMFYFHAVQSRLWNEWVSRRLTLGGKENAIEGDMVLENSADEELTLKENEAIEGFRLPTIHYVTAEEERLKTYHLHQVVMTVPGCDEQLQYPKNDKIGITKESLLAECAEIGLVATSKIAKKFNIYGTYRKMVVLVKDFTMESKTYSSSTEKLVVTDLEKLIDTSAKEIASPPESAGKTGVAAIARFSLPSGSYATCVMREFCEPIRYGG